MNRLVIALAGLILVAAGGWVLAPRVAGLFGIRLDLPAYPLPDAAALWTATGALVLIVVLALAWALTRGRGRVARILVFDAADGELDIDATVASDVVAHALATENDVVSIGATAFRVRGTTMLSLRVTARRGADLERVIAAASAAVDTLDSVLETRIPVLLHVASGVRATFAHEPRAH